MLDKDQSKNRSALYRQKHWFAIKLKNQIYKNLLHVKKRRGEQAKKRKDYFKKYYQEHKQAFITRAAQWVKEHPEERKLVLKKYKQKLKLRRKRQNVKAKIERVINEYLEYCKDRYDEETVRHYTMNIQRFLDYVHQRSTRCKEYHNRHYQESKKSLEERDLSWTKEYQKLRHIEDLDRDFITRYVSFVNHDEVNKTTGLLLNQSEKESRLYPLKSFLRYCYRKGFLKQDLCKFIYVPQREKKVLKRVLTVEEMEKFLEMPDINKTNGIRDRALLELAYSGLRAEEMLTLKLEYVDITTNTITILNGKGNKDRVIPMTNEAIYWIRRWLNRRGEIIKNGEDPGYLFITRGKKPIIRRHFSKIIKVYAKKANILIDVSPHDLRRTTATHLAENGAPIRQIQALLGHATLKVTTKYLRLTDEKIKTEYVKSHPANRRNFHYAELQE